MDRAKIISGTSCGDRNSLRGNATDLTMDVVYTVEMDRGDSYK